MSESIPLKLVLRNLPYDFSVVDFQSLFQFPDFDPKLISNWYFYSGQEDRYFHVDDQNGQKDQNDQKNQKESKEKTDLNESQKSVLVKDDFFSSVVVTTPRTSRGYMQFKSENARNLFAQKWNKSLLKSQIGNSVSECNSNSLYCLIILFEIV